MRSLINNDIEPSAGIKLVEGPVVIEEKKIISSTKQLKKSLGKKMISKEEYLKIKSLEDKLKKSDDKN